MFLISFGFSGLFGSYIFHASGFSLRADSPCLLEIAEEFERCWTADAKEVLDFLSGAAKRAVREERHELLFSARQDVIFDSRQLHHQASTDVF